MSTLNLPLFPVPIHVHSRAQLKRRIGDPILHSGAVNVRNNDPCAPCRMRQLRHHNTEGRVLHPRRPPSQMLPRGESVTPGPAPPLSMPLPYLPPPPMPPLSMPLPFLAASTDATSNCATTTHAPCTLTTCTIPSMCLHHRIADNGQGDLRAPRLGRPEDSRRGRGGRWARRFCGREG